jgi:hypothetical protein
LDLWGGGGVTESAAKTMLNTELELFTQAAAI